MAFPLGPWQPVALHGILQLPVEGEIQHSSDSKPECLRSVFSSPEKPCSSAELELLYGSEYFRGSYGPNGYLRETVDWPGWLEIIRQFKPTGRLCDLGCAYGYLIDLARQAGFQAVGADISFFALKQVPAVTPFLTQTHLARLPFQEESFDVVSVFDVLEHVAQGDRALAEAVRILKPDGLIIGSTPDPVFFDRREQTHCFERPPSFWLNLFERWGFEVAFRFSGNYQFQFLARRLNSVPPGVSIAHFHHDYFGSELEFVRGNGLTVLPRLGWRPLSSRSRGIVDREASIYLLKSGGQPSQLGIRFELSNPVREFGTLRLTLDGFLLREIFFDSEQLEIECEIKGAPLCRGGHNLTFHLEPGEQSILISHLEIECSPIDRQSLVESLPFDLYQRYALASRVVESLEARSLLDVGGVLGDESGHLASSSDFFENVDYLQTTDLRPVDLPDHIQADGSDLPFGDHEFDLVLSLDVLEHVPGSRRERFLLELDRIAQHWVVVGFPVQTPEVEEAEHHLSNSLLKTHGFLNEHAEFGLPHKDLIEGFAREQGRSLLSFSSGYLPHWLAMQALTQRFLQTGTGDELRSLNRLYNRRFLETDWRAPCYRRLFLLGKQPFPETAMERFRKILSPPSRTVTNLAQNLCCNPEFLRLEESLLVQAGARTKARSAVQFLVGERQKEILLLRQEVEHLKRELATTPLWKLGKQRLSKKWND